ncbi:uncharacterized protein Z518_02555 [Rhinocladiella mackenziei CBS 650.93]|uniref:Major facilitator superfamily (MFS) profile domain-containing protein n=1 Tax=Rhinocladiella mackenziei CBS 650.93 TaxID=1442369 RepID=A0A0D2IX04_9EURO|nr:uncharacterized protein Z518_02555 [Rhinocladiella mackenziei CBS 650.93]KIX07901.1 hypothetical protein Z518_02555 [Rhinocladiella mackenziei CBS 650.93]
MASKEEASAHIEKALVQSVPTSMFNDDEQTPNTTLQDWTPEEEKALVSNISAAYIAGMDVDIGLAIGYSISLLVFFIGYALFELPSNLVIRRVGARIWLPFLVVIWGAAVLGMGFVHHWYALAILRAILGVFEAGFFPGAVYIIASWYRQFETAKRISFYMSALLTSGFGPIAAYALSLIRMGDGTYRQGWRWIFIIEGAVTMAAGLVAPFFLVECKLIKCFSSRKGHIPVGATKAHRHGSLTIESSNSKTETSVSERVSPNAHGLENTGYPSSFQYFVAADSVYALAYFQPIILRSGMGFSYALSQILSSPPYVFAIIMSLTTVWVSDKIQMRWPIICGQCIVAIVGLLIVLYATPPGVRYFGLFLAVFGSQANGPAFLAYGQNQTAMLDKRGVVAAAMISVGAAGGVCGSTIFRSQDAPRYLPGMWTTIALQMATCVLSFCTSMYLKRQNRLADEGKRPALEGVEGFRYAP